MTFILFVFLVPFCLSQTTFLIDCNTKLSGDYNCDDAKSATGFRTNLTGSSLDSLDDFLLLCLNAGTGGFDAFPTLGDVKFVIKGACRLSYWYLPPANVDWVGKFYSDNGRAPKTNTDQIRLTLGSDGEPSSCFDRIPFSARPSFKVSISGLQIAWGNTVGQSATLINPPVAIVGGQSSLRNPANVDLTDNVFLYNNNPQTCDPSYGSLIYFGSGSTVTATHITVDTVFANYSAIHYPFFLMADQTKVDIVGTTHSLTIQSSLFNQLWMDRNLLSPIAYIIACANQAGAGCTVNMDGNTFRDVRISDGSALLAVGFLSGSGLNTVTLTNNIFRFFKGVYGNFHSLFSFCDSSASACNVDFTANTFIDLTLAQNTVAFSACNNMNTGGGDCHVSFTRNQYTYSWVDTENTWSHFLLCGGDSQRTCNLRLDNEAYGGTTDIKMNSASKFISMCDGSATSTCVLTLNTVSFEFAVPVSTTVWTAFSLCSGLGASDCTLQGSDAKFNDLRLTSSSKAFSLCSGSGGGTCLFTYDTFVYKSNIVNDATNWTVFSMCDATSGTATCKFHGTNILFGTATGVLVRMQPSSHLFSFCGADGATLNCDDITFSLSQFYFTPVSQNHDYDTFSFCSGSNSVSCSPVFEHTTFLGASGAGFSLGTSSSLIALCNGNFIGSPKCLLTLSNVTLSQTNGQRDWSSIELCQSTGGNPSCTLNSTRNNYKVRMEGLSALWSVCDGVGSGESTCTVTSTSDTFSLTHSSQGSWTYFSHCGGSTGSVCTSTFTGSTFSKWEMDENSVGFSLCGGSLSTAQCSLSLFANVFNIVTNQHTNWRYVSMCDGVAASNCTLGLASNDFSPIHMGFDSVGLSLCSSDTGSSDFCTLTSLLDVFTYSSGSTDWDFVRLCGSQNAKSCSASFQAVSFSTFDMTNFSNIISSCSPLSAPTAASTCSLNIKGSNFSTNSLSSSHSWNVIESCANQASLGNCTVTLTNNKFDVNPMRNLSTFVTMCSQDSAPGKSVCELHSDTNQYNFQSLLSSGVYNYFRLCSGTTNNNNLCVASFTLDEYRVELTSQSSGWNFCSQSSPTCVVEISSSTLFNRVRASQSDWKFMSYCDGSSSGLCNVTLHNFTFRNAEMQPRSSAVSMCGSGQSSTCLLVMHQSSYFFDYSTGAPSWNAFQFCYGSKNYVCDAHFVENTITTENTDLPLNLDSSSRFLSACSPNTSTFDDNTTCSVTFVSNIISRSVVFNSDNAVFLELCNNHKGSAVCQFNSEDPTTGFTTIEGVVDLTRNNVDPDSTSSFYSICNGDDSRALCRFFDHNLNLNSGLLLGQASSVDHNKNLNFMTGCQLGSTARCDPVVLDLYTIPTPLTINHYTSVVSLCGSGFTGSKFSAIGTRCNFTADKWTITQGPTNTNFDLKGRFFSLCNPIGNLATGIVMELPYGSADCVATVSNNVITPTMFVYQTTFDEDVHVPNFAYATAFVYFGQVQLGARSNNSALTLSNNTFNKIDNTVTPSNTLNPFAVVFAGGSNHVYSQSSINFTFSFNKFKEFLLFNPNAQIVSIGIHNSPHIVANGKIGFVSASVNFDSNTITNGFYSGPLVQYCRRIGNNIVSSLGSRKETVTIKSNSITSLTQYHTSTGFDSSAGPLFFFTSQAQADNIDYLVADNVIRNISAVVQNSQVPSVFAFFTSPKAQNQLISTADFQENTIEDIVIDNVDAITQSYTTFVCNDTTSHNLWTNLMRLGLDVFTPGPSQPALLGSVLVAHGFNTVTVRASTAAIQRVVGANILLSFRSVNVLNVNGLLVLDNVAENPSLSTTMHLSTVLSVSVTNSTQFLRNEASIGGAFYAEYSSVTLDHSTFTGNRARGLSTPSGGNAGLVLGNGGAVHMNGGSLLLPAGLRGNSQFINNSAAGNGGAVYVGYEVKLLLVQPTTLINKFSDVGANVQLFGEFNNNFANVSGGAIFALSNSFNMTAGNSTFTANTAGEAGGAVYLLNSFGNLVATTTSFFVNVVFLDNVAIGRFETPTLIRSGAAVSASRPLTFLGCVFTNNSLLSCVSSLAHPSNGRGAGVFTTSALNMTNCLYTSQSTADNCPSVHIFAASALVAGSRFTDINIEVGFLNSTGVSTFGANIFTDAQLRVNHNGTLVTNIFQDGSHVTVMDYAFLIPPDVTILLGNIFRNSNLTVGINLVDVRSNRMSSNVTVFGHSDVLESTAESSVWQIGFTGLFRKAHLFLSPVTVGSDFEFHDSSLIDSPVTGSRNGTIDSGTSHVRSNIHVAANASVISTNFKSSLLTVGDSAFIDSSTFDDLSTIEVAKSARISKGHSDTSVSIFGNYNIDAFNIDGNLVTGSFGSTGRLSNLRLFTGSWIDSSSVTTVSNVVFDRYPVVITDGRLVADNVTFGTQSPVEVRGSASFNLGSTSSASFVVTGDANITNFTFSLTDIDIASLSDDQGGTSILSTNTFTNTRVHVHGPGTLNKNIIRDSFLTVTGGGSLSQQTISRSVVELGPIGSTALSLSNFSTSKLIFRSNGQVVAAIFDRLSNISVLDGALVTFTKTKIPDTYCDDISSISNPEMATLQDAHVNCQVVGFRQFRINPGVNVIVRGGSLGGPLDSNSTVVVAQGGTFTIEGSVQSFANILNLGTIIQNPGSSLIMFDKSITNLGKWIFQEGDTVLSSSSLTLTDPDQFNSWFYNNGGEVESFGKALIGLKFNNTGGNLIVNVDSTNNLPTIIGDYTFSSPHVIFRQSRLTAYDSVTRFNYSSFHAEGTPSDPQGSFGLRFTPIITLATPFSPRLNGYFHHDPDYDGRIDDTPGSFVSYFYNNGQNPVPENRHDNGDDEDCEGCPRIITVNISDPLWEERNPIYSNQLTLVASANFNFLSVLLISLWAFAIFIISF